MSKKMPRRNGAQHQAILHVVTSYEGGGSGDERVRLNRGSTPDSNDEGTGKEDPQVLEFTDESWWARKDSNLRPMDYESTALTN